MTASVTAKSGLGTPVEGDVGVAVDREVDGGDAKAAPE